MNEILERKSLNVANGSSEIRNTIILTVVGGVFQIYLGTQSYLLSLLIPDSFHALLGTLMIVYGILSICASLLVWLQKSWTIVLIIGVCVASFATLIIFASYMMTFIVVPIYGAAINQLKNSQMLEPSD